jgi:hypothetical protein
MAGHQMNFEDHCSGLLQPCMTTGKQGHTPLPVGFQIFRMLLSVTFIVIYSHKYTDNTRMPNIQANLN